MDNINKEDNYIADVQKEARKKIIDQYIKCRKEKNLTQEELAAKLGVKRPNISRFETGQYNPTLDLLVKMAECMDLRIEVTLVDKEGHENG